MKIEKVGPPASSANLTAIFHRHRRTTYLTVEHKPVILLTALPTYGTLRSLEMLVPCPLIIDIPPSKDFGTLPNRAALG